MERIEAVCDALHTAERIAVLTHINPDGDTLGSSLALRLALTRLGKRAVVLCPDPFSDVCAILPGASEVRRPDGFDARGMLAVAVDVSDKPRLGAGTPIFDTASATVVIDHHATNEGFGQVNYIAPDCSATAVIVLDVIQRLGVPLDKEIATCIYVGISTDTGLFSQRNVNAQALRAAAQCLETGIDAAYLAECFHKMRSLAKTRLLTRALESLELFGNGRLAVMRLAHTDFAATGTEEVHTEGIIDYGISVNGTLAAVLASERNGEVKMSLRSRPPVDVAKVALSFGGGGHTLAAGCSLRVGMGEAVDAVATAVLRQMDGRGA
jgi:phosphoesterase RecJ-like protein